MACIRWEVIFDKDRLNPKASSHGGRFVVIEWISFDYLVYRRRIICVLTCCRSNVNIPLLGGRGFFRLAFPCLCICEYQSISRNTDTFAIFAIHSVHDFRFLQVSPKHMKCICKTGCFTRGMTWKTSQRVKKYIVAGVQDQIETQL